MKAGMPRAEALQHGEAGLTSIGPAEAESLLERLGAIAGKPYEVVDLYERQVSRSKAPGHRVRALARASQVASARGSIDRARGFYELALTGAPSDETLALLENAARDGDRATGGEKLRRALCAAMAQGGQGARDGGRTRGALLRRAASMAHRDLNDVEQAFAWLGDALIAHVDVLTLDALEGLGEEVNDPRRSEAALTHALSEVFDGPLVRQLLARRAKIRREQMDDLAGAAIDLKKLHDLSPTDQAVMEELSSLLTELGDYRGMVQLYEDQILRGKDMGARAELARKVARMWEEQLTDSREAADAWRRVLRMKQGDPEATAGLERAKQNMLKKPDPEASDAYAPPKLAPSQPSSAPTVATAPRIAVEQAVTLDEEPESKTSSTLETVAPVDTSSREIRSAALTSPESDRPPSGEIEQNVFTGTLPATPAASADAAERAERPRDVWFRSSQDEITMSAVSKLNGDEAEDVNQTLSDNGSPANETGKTDITKLRTGENAAFSPSTPSDGVFTSATRERQVAQAAAAEEELSHTNENATYDDEMELTAARPQRPSEVSTASALDVTGLNRAAEEPGGDEEEVVVADDLADLIETEDEEHPTDSEPTAKDEKPKRSGSFPPPLPRS